MEMKTNTKSAHTAVTNPCKLCSPLGACLVFKGIKGALPLLHGSQGCATYIRRYLISHYNEPIDIASSNFTERTTIFGGKKNLISALENICTQYTPELIGVATTCLSETIGDDVPQYLREFKSGQEPNACLPHIVPVSTPSFQGTHMEGFQATIKSLVTYFAASRPKTKRVVLFPNLVSPADIRYLKELLADFELDCVILPDYSETFDGGPWDGYQKIPQGGTAVADLSELGGFASAIELGHNPAGQESAGAYLERKFAVKRHISGLPIGIKATDRFINILETLSRKRMPEEVRKERGRLLDAYADAHKYLFEKKAVVFGEADMVVALAGFLLEIGVIPVLCATGSRSGTLKAELENQSRESGRSFEIREGVDFGEIEEISGKLKPDFMLGNSKGYSLARKLGIPLVRVGFPIHDRIGGQRILHLGYRGTQELFDRIVNTIIENTQAQSPIGYTYM